MITQAQEWLAEEIRRLRLIMVELRPPALAEQGLDSALSGHVQAFEANAGLVCDYESSFHGRLAPAAEAVLFRVAQESLANIVKHARGATAVVRLNVRGDSVELEIRDDGVGFDVEELDRAVLDGHVGLAAVRERVEMIGGMLDLESRIGAGTIVRVRVPVTDGGSRLSSRGTPPDAPANAGDLPEVERTSHEEA